MIRSLLTSQMRISHRFDNYLPEKYRVHGFQDYRQSLVPKYLKQDLTIYDVGGGKRPYINAEQKKALNATVVGLDIDRDELDKAPEGLYDRTICADIAKFQGSQDADLLICKAVLEHVRDVEGAFNSIASILKPGGLALIFVPSRNAVFARLNIILPQKMKQRILYTIFPKTVEVQGFPSYYNKCTPREFKQLAQSNRLAPIEERYYYISDYFSFFFPAYFVWRVWVWLFQNLYKEQAAETFCLVLKKNDPTTI